MAEDGTRFIVGIDLSLTGTGLSEYNLDHGTFTCETFGTTGKKGDNYALRGARLDRIADYIVAWSTAGPVDPLLAVIEGPNLRSQHGSTFDRSGLWWLVVSALQKRGIPVLVVPPKTRAKYGCGNGNGDKATVMAHVIERYSDSLDECRIRNDNEADAIALVAMGARYLGEPQEDDLPEANISAMSGVEPL